MKDGDNLIRLYKDLRIKYYVTEFIVLFILLFGNEYLYKATNNKSLELILFFIIVFIAFAITYIFTNMAVKRIQKLSVKLNGNENIREGITEIEELIKRCKNQKTKTILMINLTAAYINLGENETAMKLLTDFEPDYDVGNIGDLNKIIYLNNLCEISIREGIYDLAEQNMKVIKKLIDNDKFNDYQKLLAEKIYSDLVVELTLATDMTKEYKAIEIYYQKRFNETEDISSKVFYMSQLKKVYKKMKDKKKEKEADKYLKENKKELNYK